MRNYIVIAIVITAATAASANPVTAAPRTTPAVIQDGFEKYDIQGSRCEAGQVSMDIDTRDIVAIQPTVGTDVGYRATVLAVDATDSQVVWTIGPDAEECASTPQEWQDWWIKVGQRWEVRYRRQALAIVATQWRGIKTIAGFRVNPRNRRSAPTIKRAIRALGRPTRITRGRRFANTSCKVAWRRLGLTAAFANFGGAPPCRQGRLQSARIAGRNASRWVSVVGSQTAIATGMNITDLERQGRVDRQLSPKADWVWPLSKMYWPIGRGPDYIPAVSALTTRGVIRGFDLWVGAAGD